MYRGSAVMVHACKPRQEAEAGDLRVQGQSCIGGLLVCYPSFLGDQDRKIAAKSSAWSTWKDFVL